MVVLMDGRMALSTAINITKGSNLGKLVVAIKQQEAKFESKKWKTLAANFN